MSIKSVLLKLTGHPVESTTPTERLQVKQSLDKVPSGGRALLMLWLKFELHTVLETGTGP